MKPALHRAALRRLWIGFSLTAAAFWLSFTWAPLAWPLALRVAVFCTFAFSVGTFLLGHTLGRSRVRTTAPRQLLSARLPTP